MTKPRLPLIGADGLCVADITASVDEPQVEQEAQDEQDEQITQPEAQASVTEITEALTGAVQTVRELATTLTDTINVQQRERELDERGRELDERERVFADRELELSELDGDMSEREAELRTARELVSMAVRVKRWFKEADNALYWSSSSVKVFWQKRVKRDVLPPLPFDRYTMEQLFPALLSGRADEEDYEHYEVRAAEERAWREADRERMQAAVTVEGDSHEDTE